MGECKVYAPVAKPRKETVDRHEPKATDSEEVAEMAKADGDGRGQGDLQGEGRDGGVRQRPGTNRGLRQFIVRGLEKVKAVAMWFAIAHNMARSFALQPQPG